MRRALVIGIDRYAEGGAFAPLGGCENDAVAVGGMLERNGDGSPNFDVKLVTSGIENVSTELMHARLGELFTGEAETVLFYFAGHGSIDPATNAGHIISQDWKRGAWGISLQDILTMANAAYPRIKSTVIILDSCNSGSTGEIAGINNPGVSVIASGVTILTACDRNGSAAEVDGQGMFTNLLLDGLGGSSADVCGNITPASVYSHIDQALGPWDQRPVYKANVQTFVKLRKIAPKVHPDVLRRLPTYFKSPTDTFALDPSFEPDRLNVPEEFRNLPVNEDNVRAFKELQLCNRHGLVVPVGAEHMYYAAINSTGCKLTGLGAHYRKLAEMGRL